MSYKTFGKMKTITLPIDGSDQDLTLEEYKEKYGIELKKYIDLESGSIDLDFPSDALVLLQTLSTTGYALKIGFINSIPRHAWEEGNEDGYYMLISRDADDYNVFGIQLSIDKDDPLDFDHIKISNYEE